MDQDIEDIYFTSDPHFYHRLMVQLRGFDSDVEMNERIIEMWNSVVDKKTSRVYCLGDFSFGNVEDTEAIIRRLNGQIYLIKGNHDSIAERCKGFVWIKEVKMLRIRHQCDLSLNGKIRIWLSHYAHRVWPRSHHGSMHLYGHSHGGLPDDKRSRSMDVGMDACGLRPLSLNHILAIMQERKWEDPQDRSRNVL